MFSILAAFGTSVAQQTQSTSTRIEMAAYIEANYSKSEHVIPMRDGVKLFTQVYTPKDVTVDYPIIIKRSPYGNQPYGEGLRLRLGPSWHFVKEKYIFVFQDVRGRYMSEGEFANMRPVIPNKRSQNDIDEASDTYDTIEWLINHVPHNNGKVGVQGVSYLGFYAAMSLVQSHPALLAVSPQAPMADLFMGDDGHHYGAFYLNHAFTFFGGMGTPRKEPTTERLSWFRYPTPDAYAFFLELGPLKNIDKIYHKGVNTWWSQVMEHETYDQFWKDRSIYPHLKDVKPAALVVGGWYDAEDLLGTLQTYYHIEKQNPGLQNTLVMGPWTHGGWGRTGPNSLGVINFKESAGEYFQEKIQLPFFNYYLKGKGELNLPEAAIFETGANAWRFYDEWPPKHVTDKSVYLQSGGKLTFEKPASSTTQNYDEYISDPDHPVPYTSQIASRVTTNYFVEDQRFASRRPDVLVYTSEILEEDLTITGPIMADIHVSTSGTDSDWIVKVIDVFPDSTSDPEGLPPGVHMGGYQLMIRGDVIRGKFRNSFEKPEPFEPNKVTRVKFELPDVQHRFLKGHRMMIQIQSTWFPLIDRNPQTFCHIYKADEKDFQKAVQRVYRSQTHPSRIVVQVID